MSIPYIPLYVADYEADTAHLSLEEDGAYLRLLRLCWRTPGCSVPDDPRWIMRKMRVSADDYYRVVEPLIDEFFTRGMGRVFSARLQREEERIKETSKKRSEAGLKGGRPAKSLKNNETTKSRAKAKQKHLKPELELEPDKEESFDAFWKVWPNKNGKADAIAAFSKLESEDRASATGLASGWFSAWRKKHPDASPILPATYLRKRRWEDEFEGSKPAASESEVWERRAAAVKSRQEWQTRHLTPTQVSEMISRNLVTIEECRKAGVA